MIPDGRVRAVVDTNVLVRGLLNRRASSAVRVLRALAKGKFVMVSSDYIFDEVARTLRETDVRNIRALSDVQIEAVIGALRVIGDVVPGHFRDVERVSSDPNDNPVVAAAIEGRAGYLVTDDRRDLLPLKVITVAGFRPVQVIAPGPFVKYVLQP